VSTTVDLLTVQEFAQLAKMHPRSVYRLIAQGRIEHIKIGGAVRIPSSVLRKVTVAA
jgi:excisionase family DNA binding protein